MKNLVVVLPVARPDYHLAVRWLKWAAYLGSLVQREYDLVVFGARSLSQAQQDELAQIALLIKHGKFRGNPETFERPELGYAAAANHMMLQALKMAEEFYPGQPMLWVEADTAPMRASWVDEIQVEYYAAGKPFMGDFHAQSEIPHMTGNAVYPPDWRERAPSLLSIVENEPEWGWDSKCAWQTVPQMHRAATIQQIWMPPRFTEKTMGMIHPETALFHRCKNSSLLDVLTSRLGINIPLGAQEPGPVLRVLASKGPKEGPRVDILIVTHAKDMEFLRYCVRGIQRYSGGFGGVTIAAPLAEKGNYTWLPSYFKVCHYQDVPGKGMLQHMIIKCRADEICPEADMILHLDADCMPWEDFGPNDYKPWDKPLLIRERYAVLQNPNRRNWQQVVTNATGLVPAFETMVRHPQIHLRDVYRRTREIVERHTGRGFDDYVLSGQNVFPQQFCEFNTLGSVALQEFASLYLVQDYNRELDARECDQDPAQSWQYIYRAGRDKMIETWSHGGITSYMPLLDGILRGQRPAYYVK